MKAAWALAVLLLAGCADGPQATLAELGFAASAGEGPLAAADLDWPDFSGQTLRILDHGAFDYAFAEAAPMFEELTGAAVEHFAADDTGSALNIAILQKGDPDHDVIYGLDNALLRQAVDAGVLAPYTPQLGGRVASAYDLSLPDPWPATPVDHGYIALNIDSGHPELAARNVTIDDLFDVRDHADLFVTEDPRFSTPGLGFLLTTIDAFGEATPYDWQDYWTDLFAEGVRVTPDWSTAYEVYFTGGYGAAYPEDYGHVGGHPIVASYSESPAYEAYFGAAETADVLLDHRGRPATFHQIQTMAVLEGTDNLALAQAWIEFTLTDHFQALAAPASAVYPVVDAVSTDEVYGDLDPEPGTFPTVGMGWQTIGAHLENWLAQWTALCEAHDCA